MIPASLSAGYPYAAGVLLVTAVACGIEGIGGGKADHRRAFIILHLLILPIIAATAYLDTYPIQVSLILLGIVFSYIPISSIAHNYVTAHWLTEYADVLTLNSRR